MSLEKRLGFFRLLFTQRQKIACSATFQRVFVVVNVSQEIL